MKTIIIKGTISPEKSHLGLEFPEYEAIIGETKCDIILNIKDGKLNASVNVYGDYANVDNIASAISSIAHTAIDFESLSSGVPGSIDIHTAQVSEDYTIFPIRKGLPEIADIHNYKFDPNLYESFYHNKNARLALKDFRLSLQDHDNTYFHAYRMLEQIRLYFQTGSTDKAAAWKEMRRNLLVSRESIENVKRGADHQRHGDYIFGEYKERVSVMRYSREVLYRFLLRIHKGQPLSEEEYTII
ncbi:hypothetical protein [Niveispirillum cyanobacteriorum]|uniref:hypothetical protein n=1 Tax=Niveispirillum cyanobacteriorum TaxID=1612173 RepID=UPI001319C824|nr:hypothetical protein [Niveispirillum cyanobacteriorum]GGE85708.1 hypothetical protein GCM10011317_48610 [Niveispirillum cyanobacteriorum]